MGGAGLQGHIQGGASGIMAALSAVPQRFDFGMRLAGLVMVAFAHAVAALNQDGANQRVGRSLAERTSGEGQRPAHPKRVGFRSVHFPLPRLKEGVGELMSVERL